MELGLYTDSVKHDRFEQALDLAVEVGATGIEIATGGQSSAPHLRVDELLADASRRSAFAGAFSQRGLRIAALNCSAWPMHPRVGDDHVALIRKTFRLASELGVTKLVTMSGCPGDGPAGTTVNFAWYPWPSDVMAMLDRQWDEALELWRTLADDAAAHGIERIAFELHPLHLVYNVPTLHRMRSAIGPIIGANMDPSHLFWQGMDPIAAIEALGDAVYHVHLKDTQVVAHQVAIAGVLDSRPFEDPDNRAWVFRTVGTIHGIAFWSAFIDALKAVGYDDALAIENEDASVSPREGVKLGAAFMRPLLAAAAIA